MDYKLIKMALSEIRSGMKKISTRKIAVTSTMKCCGSCHCAELESKGYVGYLSAKIFRSGGNRNFDSISRWKSLYFNWSLEEVELKYALQVLSKYFIVLPVENSYSCIEVKNKVWEVTLCG